MNGEQNIDGKALLSWVTWTCFQFLGRTDFQANVTICQGNVAQIALFHLLLDLLPCLCLLERKKREILFETCNWSVKFPAVINFKIHFDFSVLKAKSPPGWQEEFMFDGLEGIASLLRSAMIWSYLRDTFIWCTNVIIFENTTTTGQRNVFRKVNFSSPL